jgi:hypothetical protein
MSRDVREVEDVLAVLAPKIEGCREKLSAQAQGNALYGLQSMSSGVGTQDRRLTQCDVRAIRLQQIHIVGVDSLTY